jgi:hypothetical protein
MEVESVTLKLQMKKSDHFDIFSVVGCGVSNKLDKADT